MSDIQDQKQAETMQDPQELMETKIQEVLETVDEKFEVEAIAQMVEQMDFGDQLNKRLQAAFSSLRQSMVMQNNQVNATQGIIRELMLDMALVKRALTSLGQIGVSQRQRIEKELILEVFPPGQVQNGTGISVARSSNKTTSVDGCDERRAICKSACCRIFNVPLTPQEVLQGYYEWNPHAPYTLEKNPKGCIYLRDKDYLCEKYGCRPSVCSSYSCVNDKRIWADFEKKILNPELAKRLDSLDPTTKCQMCSNSTQTPKENLKERSVDVSPPDFSKLREMIVPEPEHKFVPPISPEKEKMEQPEPLKDPDSCIPENLDTNETS